MSEQDKAIDSLLLATRLYFGGDIPGAVQELSRAEQLATEEGDTEDLVLILVQKAQYLREMGRVDEGRALLAQAQSKLDEVPAEKRAVAFAMLRLEQGIVENGAGSAALAEQLLREAESEARKYESGIAILSDILANLASIYLDAGKLKQAQEILNEAVLIDRKAGNARALSNDLNILSMVYGVMGDHSTEERYLLEALKVALDSGYLKEATDAALNLGQLAENRGDLDEAESDFRFALDSYEKIGNKREAANVRTSLGIMAARKGNLAEAEKLFQQSYQEHNATEQPSHAVRDLINLAYVLLQEDQVEAAYNSALKAAEQAENLGLLDILWYAHYSVARVLTSYLKATIQDNHELAVRLNDEVLPRYARAINSIELLRTGIGRPEEREYMLGGKEDVYEEAIFLAGTLHQPRNAFVFSERARARAFLDTMGAARIEQSAAKNPLTQRRQELTQQILELEDSDPAKFQNLLHELHLLRAQISAEAPAIAAITESQMPSLQAIFDAIPLGAALVEFFICTEHTEKYLVIFVLTNGGIRAFTIMSLGTFDLPAKVAQFRAELQYEVEGVPTGRELFTVLFSQVWDVLQHVDRLLIVPHRELHYLPFGALWFDNVGEGPKKIYLCQRFMHTVLPSAAFLPLCLNLPRPPFQTGQSLVLGNPTEDLPGAEEEAKLVASYLEVEQLVRGRATRDTLLTSPQDFAAIHVASHGAYDENDPLLSRILLADGPVTVEDMMGSHLATNLLTLSGCVTSLGQRKPGDELIGLARAAAFAGVPSIVTALWEIWDESSRVFFDHFYRCLLSGMPKDAALISAQHMLLSTEEFAHPMYWAPFVLIGDWLPIRMKNETA